MSDFDPGPGWREVTEREWLSTPIDHDHLELASNGKIRHWVREVPVPALPTAPYTVIRVTFSTGAGDLLVHNATHWRSLGSGARIDSLAPGTKVEVLAEPRAVTARAVLDAVRYGAGPEKLVSVGLIDVIERDFGVES